MSLFLYKHYAISLIMSLFVISTGCAVISTTSPSSDTERERPVRHTATGMPATQVDLAESVYDPTTLLWDRKNTHHWLDISNKGLNLAWREPIRSAIGGNAPTTGRFKSGFCSWDFVIESTALAPIGVGAMLDPPDWGIWNLGDGHNAYSYEPRDGVIVTDGRPLHSNLPKFDLQGTVTVEIDLANAFTLTFSVNGVKMPAISLPRGAIVIPAASLSKRGQAVTIRNFKPCVQSPYPLASVPMERSDVPLPNNSINGRPLTAQRQSRAEAANVPCVRRKPGSQRPKDVTNKCPEETSARPQIPGFNESDVDQCAEAASARECSAALPGCNRLLAHLTQASPSLAALTEQEADEAHRKVLFWTAACESRLDHYARAIEYFRTMLTISQRRYGSEHIEVAGDLSVLASALFVSRSTQEAEQLQRQALAILQKQLGAEHIRVSESLKYLANILAAQDKKREAEQLLRQALAMLQKLLGVEHAEVADILRELATVLTDQGRYQESDALLQQCVAMQRKLLGFEHHEVARSLTAMSSLLRAQGKYVEAESVHRSALAILQKQLGSEHVGVAFSLRGLASLLHRQGKYPESEHLQRQALEMMQRVLGSEHTAIADSLTGLAAMLSDQGKYQAAESLVRRALAIRQKLLGPEHLDIASSLSDMATLLNEQGRYQAAESLLREALAIRHKLLGPEHLNVADNLHDLAITRMNQSLSDETESLVLRGLSIRKKLLGADHVQVAQSLEILAAVQYFQENFHEAELTARQSLSILQRWMDSDHPNVTRAQLTLARILISEGRYESAETLLRSAVERLQRDQSLHREPLSHAALFLATVHINRDRFRDAIPLFKLAARSAETKLTEISSEPLMRVALVFMYALEERLHGLLLQKIQDADLNQLVMTTALLRKGRVAEAGSLANRLLHNTNHNPQRTVLFERWQQLRQQRETLLFGGIGKLSSREHHQRLEELRLQADDLEIQLAASEPKLRLYHPPKFDEVLPAVAARLPKDGALVEVLWIKPYNFKAKGIEDQLLTPHYFALVMTADQHIEAKDLGEASIVDNQVQAFLAALRSPSSDPKDKAKALYDQILKPLLSSSINHVYLSLDGALNLVPFDALHDGTDYLLGRRTFHYLSSGRDLLRTDATEAKQPALLIADPDFGQTGRNRGNAGPETFYQRLAGLNRLAGAQQEARRIGSLLHVTPIVGSAAKESVIRAAQSPWLVHIASHGLFLKGQDLPRAGVRGSALFGIPFSERKLVPLTEGKAESLEVTGGSDSLSRSALVLADAAKGEGAASAAEDGLLTAEEARSLNLFGTQLVVLSACDTAQGELSAGQGVYGLRRAFLVAGAETLVTSLWQVNDAATGELMTLYYQKLLTDKKGRLAAMQESMQEMRKKYQHPYYWAPFLVIGSDGPLRPAVKSQPAARTP